MAASTARSRNQPTPLVMARLALSCFGTFQATLDNVPLTGFHSVKGQCLLAYLALEADRPHQRTSLADLFWPLDAETSARNSFRQTLYELRKLLGDRGDLDPPFLMVTRQSVQFNPATHLTLDVAEFLTHIQNGRLEQATTLYRGELLAGLSCESEPFEEWLRLTRQHFHNLAVDLYAQLTQRSLDASDPAQAMQYARRQLALEPWREEAHRQLMTALALSGERTAALAQYETCRQVLAAELGVAPDTETAALYEQIKQGKLRGQRRDPLPASPRLGEEPSSRLATSQTVRHNLPPQPTPFIGRQNDLAQIATRLADPACRLLTIVGPGGMGKTRLALQAAQSILDFGFGILDAAATPTNNPKSQIQNPKLQDGVFFVALAGVASVDHLVSTIAAALDFTFYGSADPKTQLLDYLRSRSMLLVLDNFEHLLDGAELVSEILGASPASKVLATSRELLNLREEWLHPLSGMSFPVEETTSERLESYSAVQFFVQCARQMQPGFDLAADATAVVRICCLVEGMPLSIELATTWLRLFPCEQVAREVEQSLDFLTTSARNVPARHRSMKAVFEHSWRLLSEEEQTVLRRLSIFRGGFDRTAAQQVAGASFPLLVTLTEKSLIQIGSGERYQMHELLRQFAEEKLRTDLGEYEQVQDDHCHYYLTWLSQQESRLKGREHLAAVVEIETEIENVRAAWAWAVTHDDLDAIERSLEGLAYFYETKLWQDQSIILFQKAIAVLTERPHEDRRQILLAMILAKQGIAYGHLSAEGGKFALLRIREQLENCLTLLQRFGEIKATAEIYLAFFWLVESPQQRLLLWLRALAIYERRGDRWKMAHTFEGLGFFANLLGHYEEAKHYYQCGLALCEELGDRLLLANIQALLAEVHRALGEYEEAIRLAGASLVSRTEIGNQRGIAFSLYVLGTIASRMGNLEDALRYSRQSRETFTEIGLLGGIDYALSNLGHIATAMGDYAEARRQFHKILQSSLARDVLSIHLPVPLALVGMAEVLCQEGQPEAAIELVEQVLRRPNAWQETKDRAIKLLAELQATVPPAVSAEAQARGRTTDLHTTVVRLLGVTPA